MLLLELPLALEGLDEDGLVADELPPALEGLELMLLEPWRELEPLADCAASHSERLIWPSWFLSILSNFASREELADEPPAEALLPAADELVPDVPPAEDDEEGEVDLLLCDMDGEDDEPELLFESPAAYAAAAKARSEKLRNTGLMNFMQCLLLDRYRSMCLRHRL